MSTVNRSLKARAKVVPDRLQNNVSSRRVIRNRKIEANHVLHLAEAESLSIDSLPTALFSVPLAFWLEHKEVLMERGEISAVQLASDQQCEDIVDDLDNIDMVVLPFVNFVDGRGYSHARKLRSQYGFQGEIRAIGDVHYDQLYFLERCGCDAFELPESDDYEVALNAFTEFSEAYQPATDERTLIFSRRRIVH